MHYPQLCQFTIMTFISWCDFAMLLLFISDYFYVRAMDLISFLFRKLLSINHVYSKNGFINLFVLVLHRTFFGFMKKMLQGKHFTVKMCFL